MSISVAYLGPKATYTHEAAINCFGDSATFVACSTIKSVVDAVEDGSASYGVIPWENSSYGYVDKSVDLLADRGLVYKDIYICGEAYVDVRHCLLGFNTLAEQQTLPASPSAESTGKSPFDRIKSVYSHDQAIQQTKAFQGKFLKSARMKESDSTSAAAALVALERDPSIACISSPRAAKEFGLEVLASNISDRSDNKTRFFVLRKCDETAEKQQRPLPRLANLATTNLTFRSMVWFRLHGERNDQLVEVMQIFQTLLINVTAWGSRPSWAKAWDYLYFVEFESEAKDGSEDAVNEALVCLGKIVPYHRWYGSWITAANR